MYSNLNMVQRIVGATLLALSGFLFSPVYIMKWILMGMYYDDFFNWYPSFLEKVCVAYSKTVNRIVKFIIRA